MRCGTHGSVGAGSGLHSKPLEIITIEYRSIHGGYQWSFGNTTPKTGRSREVYFTDETSALLRSLRKKQLETCVSPFVFPQDDSQKPMHPDSPNRYLHKFGEKYGIEIRPHMLRHSFASAAIVNGADIASVSEILCHADKSTTLRLYTHADEQSKRKAAAIVAMAIKQA